MIALELDEGRKQRILRGNTGLSTSYFDRIVENKWSKCHRADFMSRTMTVGNDIVIDRCVIFGVGKRLQFGTERLGTFVTISIVNK